MKKILITLTNIGVIIGVALAILPVGVVLAINTPEIWYRLNPGAIEDEIRALSSNPFAADSTLLESIYTSKITPEPDSTIIKGRRININRIGVQTNLIQTDNERAALEKGVWLMPKYGTPDNNDMPVILAAHRWGPTNITSDYRARNMFVNLPHLGPGNKIVIEWDQRRYIYEVQTKKSEPSVSELADLILITCEYYNSDQRVIVYAARVN